MITNQSLQASHINTESAVIKLRGFQRLNRIALYLALGGGVDGAPAADAGAPTPPADADAATASAEGESR